MGVLGGSVGFCVVPDCSVVLLWGFYEVLGGPRKSRWFCVGRRWF